MECWKKEIKHQSTQRHVVPCEQLYSQSDYQLDFGRIFPIKTDYRTCSKSIINLYTFLNVFPNQAPTHHPENHIKPISND